MRRHVFILLVFLISVWAVPAIAEITPAGTPTKAIQDLDKKLDDYRTGPNLSEEDKVHNKALKQDILHGTFDVDELSRLALANHWFPLTYSERQQFVDVMTELLENRAILSKEQGQKKSKSQSVYSIRYTGDKYLNAKKSRALTTTTVYVKSEDITVKLDYKLRIKEGEWRAYDVIMDGASLVDNYKYQFDRIITQNDYNELIRRMQKKLNEIKTESDADNV